MSTLCGPPSCVCEATWGVRVQVRGRVHQEREELALEEVVTLVRLITCEALLPLRLVLLAGRAVAMGQCFPPTGPLSGQ